jgi:CRISPR-associated protein Csb2
VPLRVPKAGTLDDLMRKHQDFLGRLSADGFKPVPPLRCFDVVAYHSPTAGVGKAPERPFAAFQILAPDASKVRSFSVGRGVRDVAAWVRNATTDVCRGWPFAREVEFVHGHDPADPNKPLKGADADARFSYLPLPSVERRGDGGERVTSIRRVLVTAPVGCGGQVEWVRRRLSGHELVREDRPGEAVGLLTLLPRSDWVLRQYIGEGEVWSTVTPVLLPGYDDRDPAKAEGLLREALGHAGLPAEVVGPSEVELRRFGFRAGVEPARGYERAENLRRFPAYHVRVRFSRPAVGPLAVGAGRYRGFGLFVREDETATG